MAQPDHEGEGRYEELRNIEWRNVNPKLRGRVPAKPSPSSGFAVLRFLCMADTHGVEVVKDDLADLELDAVIHAGDISSDSNLEDYRVTANFLRKIEAQHKLIIAGNHDGTLDVAGWDDTTEDSNYKKWEGRARTTVWGRKFGKRCQAQDTIRSVRGLTLLNGSHKIINFANGASLKVYGSPFTAHCRGGHQAFTYPKMMGHDFQIDDDTDLVITHGPPLKVLDRAGRKMGSVNLMNKIQRARPLLHVFGHVHDSWGARLVTWKTEIPQAFETPRRENESSLKTAAAFEQNDIRSLMAQGSIYPRSCEWCLENERSAAEYEPETKARLDGMQFAYLNLCSAEADGVAKKGEGTLFVNAACDAAREKDAQSKKVECTCDLAQWPFVVDIEVPLPKSKPEDNLELSSAITAMSLETKDNLELSSAISPETNNYTVKAGLKYTIPQRQRQTQTTTSSSTGPLSMPRTFSAPNLQQVIQPSPPDSPASEPPMPSIQ